ncbi:MAG: hypothetical protein JO311_08510, partial [Candidatus Eremiobacteraeota bacterium]|nr:hypothetical protein [Candidatus Eremiobacteraeota bacterium]
MYQRSIMRAISLFACTVLLSSCAQGSSPLPNGNAFSRSPFDRLTIRPATGPWLCGQMPSLRARVDVGPPFSKSYRSLYAFKAGNTDGALPYGNLVSYNGNFYGTTDQGGTVGWGTVFEITPAGKEKVLYSFQ